MTTQILFEDDHFLAAVKPSGIPTHAAAPGETGFVEQLSAEKNIQLGVHQRLDAATSGVIVFSKTPQGAKRLASAFELRNVRKIYRALVCGHPGADSGIWKHHLAHQNGVTVETPSGKFCESRFHVLKTIGPFTLLDLDLRTGMTHQLRVQCALAGCPILGDTVYGGGEAAPRLCLHAYQLRLISEPNLPKFEAPLPEILAKPSLEFILKQILNGIDNTFPADEAVRLTSPQHSGIPEVILEKLANTLLIRHLEPDSASLWSVASLGTLMSLAKRRFGCEQVCYRVHESSAKSHPCRAFSGKFSEVPEPFEAHENGVRYAFDLSGNATGLYLDQRENRAWVRENARGRVINLFAYTCAFSVCAAKSPNVTETTSIDSAGAALRRGRDNFVLNGISLDGHRFITEDAQKYLARCAQNGTRFDTVICDPPSFGRSGKAVFSLDAELENLVAGCLAVAAPGATVLFSINHRKIRLGRLKSAFKDAMSRLRLSAKRLDVFVNDDALGPLGVGTDLKTVRLVLDNGKS
ncbi:MAG: class I SAM-dependent methyltransferase [Proteobacteria bacterium]|nr:class I SAM-dependent methyltransferase [Pseudomonadota bacterium]